MNRTITSVDLSGLPPAVRAFAEGSVIYDSSCSADARVLFLDRGQGYYLKIAPERSLRTESDLTGYFHDLGFSAPVCHYETRNGNDWLITEKVPGEDCIHPDYLADPDRLCDTAASFLRSLHETDGSACPVQDRLDSYKRSVIRLRSTGLYEPDRFEGIWEFSSYERAWQEAEEGMELIKPNSLIHGDFCLPNILLKDWKFSGLVDLGEAGIADRHLDILRFIWSLKYNLGTVKYTGRFMDAYGRDFIDPDVLRRFAAMEVIGG